MAGSEDRIRERAHELWVQAGRPDGHADHFWFAAEQETTTDDDEYDKALADSFPASDPPGNSGITGPEPIQHTSQDTTAGEPAGGGGPGGTRPTRRKSPANSAASQTVRSGDRNDAPASWQ